MLKDISPQSRPELSNFNWEDLFLLETQLKVDESMILDSANAYGTEEQCKKYLPSLAAGTSIGCFGLT